MAGPRKQIVIHLRLRSSQLVVLYLEHGAIPDAIAKPVEHGPDPGPVVAVIEDQAKLLAIQGGVDLRPVGVIDHGALLR